MKSLMILVYSRHSVRACCYGNRFVVIDVMLLLMPLAMLLSMPVVVPVVLPLASGCSCVGVVRLWCQSQSVFLTLIILVKIIGRLLLSRGWQIVPDGFSCGYDQGVRWF